MPPRVSPSQARVPCYRLPAHLPVQPPPAQFNLLAPPIPGPIQLNDDHGIKVLLTRQRHHSPRISRAFMYVLLIASAAAHASALPSSTMHLLSRWPSALFPLALRHSSGTSYPFKHSLQDNAGSTEALFPISTPFSPSAPYETDSQVDGIVTPDPDTSQGLSLSLDITFSLPIPTYITSSITPSSTSTSGMDSPGESTSGSSTLSTPSGSTATPTIPTGSVTPSTSAPSSEAPHSTALSLSMTSTGTNSPSYTDSPSTSGWSSQNPSYSSSSWWSATQTSSSWEWTSSSVTPSPHSYPSASWSSHSLSSIPSSYYTGTWPSPSAGSLSYTSSSCSSTSSSYPPINIPSASPCSWSIGASSSYGTPMYCLTSSTKPTSSLTPTQSETEPSTGTLVPVDSNQSTETRHRVVIIGGIFGGLIMLALLAFLAAWLFLSRRRRSKRRPPKPGLSFYPSEPPMLPPLPNTGRRLSLDSEMQQYTQNPASVYGGGTSTDGASADVVAAAVASTSTVGAPTSDSGHGFSTSNLSHASQVPLITTRIVTTSSETSHGRHSASGLRPFSLRPPPKAASKRRTLVDRLRELKERESWVSASNTAGPIPRLPSVYDAAPRRPPPTPLYQRRFDEPGMHLPIHGERDMLQRPPQWPNLTPGLTLPPLPSPAGTVGTVPPTEGLLHPRLTLLSDAMKSKASFSDHLDYSRPISGYVGQRAYTNATFASSRSVNISHSPASDDGQARAI